MMKFVMNHPSLAPVYIWFLGTQDAHRVYTKLGFGPIPEPQNWMMIINKQDWTARAVE